LLYAKGPNYFYKKRSDEKMPAVKICEISKDKIGQKITAYAVVKEKFRKLTINQPQKEYLEVHITDGTAGAVLKIWEPNDLLDKLCSPKT